MPEKNNLEQECLCRCHFPDARVVPKEMCEHCRPEQECQKWCHCHEFPQGHICSSPFTRCEHCNGCGYPIAEPPAQECQCAHAPTSMCPVHKLVETSAQSLKQKILSIFDKPLSDQEPDWNEEFDALIAKYDIGQKVAFVLRSFIRTQLQAAEAVGYKKGLKEAEVTAINTGMVDNNTMNIVRAIRKLWTNE